MRGIQVGRGFGIPIRLHWSFLLVLPLFAFIIGLDIATLTELLNDVLGAGLDPAALEGEYLPWVLGLTAALGLFTGVLLHEFGHSLVAMRYGYEIDSITLWLLGGLASFTEMPEDWRQEFWISVAGPIVSVGVGIACYGGFLVTPVDIEPLRFLFGYLALLNIVLAVFNMLPAFPMDGGRVLRALLARKRPHARATQLAAEVGKLFAFLLGAVGLLSLNIVLILLAFFIYIAASGEAQQTVMKATFEGVRVRDVMTARVDLHTVSPETTVATLIERMFKERHTGYPVVDSGVVVGMVTLDDARDVRPEEREAFLVEDVMSSDVVSISPDADAMETLQTLREHDIGRLPVVTEGGDFVGLVSRTDLMTAFDVLQGGGGLNSILRSPSKPDNRVTNRRSW
ncbi:CBS domain-containing protein [Halovenus salina]|uniref:CBS domain-containing protein n=1 Tax=Halovenus salina TaxID=1510225 RepID=UPI002260CDB0|nr:CBS domain-containing protein [Halovenus salina]